ncbi:hypothetical protein [Bacillus pumilus]|uniref:hypothetical protein n=1 Tax=Bacillus pumilus TaxID=1408 RepID=UPI001642D48D|nr:hypothetical protein [Bacillus pumilus]
MIYDRKGGVEEGGREENLVEVVRVGGGFGGGGGVREGISVVEECIEEFGGERD